MNTYNIEQLLEKYWLCQTTVLEEEQLRTFFLTQELPEHLKKYKAIFSLQEEEQEITLDDSFDEKILRTIETAENKPKRKLFFRPILQVAASIAVILSVWFSLQFINQQQNDPWKQDTFQNPEQALAEVQKVLSVVSDQIERSQELVMENMEKTKPLTQFIK